MQFWLRTWLAVLLVLSPGVLYGLGETMVVLSDDQLVAEADYCVIGTLTDQRNLAVEEVVFGPLATKELRFRFPWDYQSPQPQEKWIVYLEQDFAEIRCVTGGGARRVKGTRVETNETRKKPQFQFRDTKLIMSDHPFPTELDHYVRKARDCWQLAATKRRNSQNEALQRVFDPKRYPEKNGNAPAILYDVLWNVHADDTDTLNRMANLIRDKPEPLYMHARGSFVQVIARKNFRAGFDVIRAEAFRRSRAGQNWASERDALTVLAAIGTAGDVELMKENIVQLSKQRYSNQPLDAFNALGNLANRVFAYDSGERHALRQWLERYCTEPTDLERELSFHKMAIVSLGPLGRKESLPLLRRLQAEDPGGWNEQAIARIEQRLKDEAPKQSEQEAVHPNGP